MTGSRTRLVLWRHGQTDHNVERRFQGQADVPLNEVGLGQAQQAAALLAQLPVDVVVSSPPRRALVTSQTLAKRLALPVATDDRLMEISVGSWEGLLDSDVYAAHPDFALALDEGRDFRRSPEGETALEVGERVGAALREIADANPGKTVVVGCHGLAIRMGTANVLGWDYPTTTRLASMFNCGWTTLTARPQGDWKLVTWNQVALQRPS